MEINIWAVLAVLAGLFWFAIGYHLGRRKYASVEDLLLFQRKQLLYAHRVLRDQEREIRELSPEKRCTDAPKGWKCKRKHGHDGPCAAVPDAPALARIIFRQNFAPNEDPRVINEKWDEWPEERNKAIDLAKEILRYF